MMTWLAIKAIFVMSVWRVEWLPTALFDTLLLPWVGMDSALAGWVLKRQIDIASLRNVRLWSIRRAMDRYMDMESGGECEQVETPDNCVRVADWWK